MRRGRMAVTAAASFAAAAVVATGAVAATPMDICRDLQDNGRLDGTYSTADLQAWAQDPTVQGYCSPIVVPPTTTTTPPTTTTTPSTPTTTTTPVTTSTPTTTGGGTAGEQKTITKTKPTSHVAAASKTLKQPRAAAPLAATHTGGTLPFTGLQLGLFAIVGAALLAGGFLLRASARHDKSGS
jgi:hypothetical protein